MKPATEAMLTLFSILRRRLVERRHYRRSRDWWLSLYNRAMIRWPFLPFQERVCAVSPVATDGAIYLRLGTSDWYVFEEIFVRRDYEAAVDWGSGVRTILDLGANVGLSVRFWQDRFPAARVVAVEADARNAELCGANARMDRVTIVQACVAAKSGSVYLDRSGAAWAYHMTRDPRGQKIRAMTIPELLASSLVDGDIDLLKCDIEGAEAEVFADCQEWIGRIRSMVVEVHAPYTSDRLLQDVGPTFEAYRRVPGKPHEVLFLRRRTASGHGDQ
jgi:FkbM family methyltransferase